MQNQAIQSGSGALRAKWQSDQFTLNAWLSIGSGYAAEVLGHMPYDSITVDMQHGMFGFETAVAMLQASSTAGAVPMVRVPANEAWMIQQVLDAGASGVICPMINSAEECAQFVRAARYSPVGQRSFGPARCLLVGGKDYVATANEQVLTWAMIETRSALDNLEGIVSVPGLDGIYIGPSDLSMELEGVVSTPLSGAVVDRILDVIARARAARPNILIGIFCPDTEFAKDMAAEGCDLLTILNDVGMLRLATSHIIGAMHPAAQARNAAGSGR